jgi:hypothetical protein
MPRRAAPMFSEGMTDSSRQMPAKSVTGHGGRRQGSKNSKKFRHPLDKAAFVRYNSNSRSGKKRKEGAPYGRFETAGH